MSDRRSDYYYNTLENSLIRFIPSDEVALIYTEQGHECVSPVGLEWLNSEIDSESAFEWASLSEERGGEVEAHFLNLEDSEEKCGCDLCRIGPHLRSLKEKATVVEAAALELLWNRCEDAELQVAMNELNSREEECGCGCECSQKERI